MSNTSLKPVPQPLPATTEAFLAHRKMREKRTVNDRVEDVHLRLINNETYRDLLFAIFDEQAIEASMEIDDVLAAKMIRDDAVRAGDYELGREKLATIVKSLRVVLRRYRFSRNERRAQVGDTVVTPLVSDEESSDS